MHFAKFQRRNQLIMRYLQQVETGRDQIDWYGAMHPPDPVFRDVLFAQERLLNALERLLEEFVKEDEVPILTEQLTDGAIAS